MAQIQAKVGAHVHGLSPHRNEAVWWKGAGINPAKAARKLSNDSRMD
jgi:hypothetical protein